MLLDQRVRRAGSHHQKLVVLRHPGRPRAGRRVRRRHRPVPRPPRRRRAPRRSAGRAAGEGVRRQPALARRAARAARARSSARSTRCSASAGPTRARWTPTTRSPGWRTSCAVPTSSADPLPEQPPDPAPAGRCRGPGAAHLPRDPPAHPVRAPTGERSVARGYAKAFRPGPPADLPRGPVHVVAAHRPAARRRAARQPAAAPGRGRAAPPRRRRPARAAAQRGRPAAGHRHLPRGRRRPGARVRRGEPRGHAGLRAREGRRRSTTCGRASAARTSTGARGPTTASCPAPCSTRPATRASPADPAGLGDGARTFARDLRLTLAARAPRPAGRRQRRRRPARPGRASCAPCAPPPTRLDAWHAAGRAGPRPPGRLRPHNPEQLPLRTELWAVPIYRLVYDPDGRPLRARLRGYW